jgi:hypothetical protein
MSSILNDPTFLEVLLTIITLAWTFFKATDWYKKHVTEPRMESAIDSVAAAVLDTYREYVKGAKAASDTGKLTEEQAAKAREIARDKAIELAKTKGIDLVKTVGADFIDLYIEKKIVDSKNGLL